MEGGVLSRRGVGAVKDDEERPAMMTVNQSLKEER